MKACCAALVLSGAMLCPSIVATAQVPFATVADSARLAPTADVRIVYGAAPQQFAELRLPVGKGTHPVVMLLHGGCWSSQYDLSHLAGAAESLRRAGYATWTVEYRRAGDAGGGDPGTFDDIRLAYDSLRAHGARHRLDLSRIVVMGHSAGGHLALWLASEPGVNVRGTLGLAAITDPAPFAHPSGCGAGIARLMGGPPAELASQYAARSPVLRSPAVGTVRLVVARDDRIVPRAQSEVYLSRFAGTRIDEVAGGHFDLVAPWTDAWRTVVATVAELLR